MQVWSKERGLRRLKADASLSEYQEKYPSAIEVETPDMETLEEWLNNSGCSTVADCCWVEPDGECSHGYPSWFIALGLV